MLRIFLILLGLLILAAAGAAGVAFWAKQEFETKGPGSAGGTPAIFSVEKGWGLTQIAEKLEGRGLIRNAYVFRAAALYYRKQHALKAGEYAIPAGASMRQIMRLLEEGKSIVYKLTVPEGLTSAMIIELVRKSPVLAGEVSTFPPEGTMLPETYLFPRGMDRNELIRRMQADHTKVLEALWAKRQTDLPIKSKYEAVILASIVEKETGKSAERPRVAGVFVNRLRKGIKLQSDPTIIYDITRGYPLGREIRQSELNAASPFNTYVIPGLPPTPIANPGKASLAAVLNPMQTEEIYFVADGTGGHAFAITLEEHNRNVARWREYQNQQRAGAGGG